MALRDLIHFGHHNKQRERSDMSMWDMDPAKLFREFLTPVSSFNRWSDEFSRDILADIKENDKEFTITAELPGIDKKNLDIEMRDRYLVIKGEKREEKEDKNDNYISRERYYGKIERSFYLPEAAEFNKADARFKDGILIITIPKKEGIEKPARLQIK